MRKFISFLLVFTVGLTVFAENGSDSFEFVNQDLKDIVYILSGRLDTPVICDETVTGKGTLLYKGNSHSSINDVFQAFLKSNRLYVKKTETLWTVSKIKVETSQASPVLLLNTDCFDSTLKEIFQQISLESGTSIIFETLPSEKTDIHLSSKTPYETVKALMESHEDFVVSEKDNLILVSRKFSKSGSSFAGASTDFCQIALENGLYSGAIKDAEASGVLEKLFELQRADYSSFLGTREKIDALTFSKRTFEQVLTLILEQINGEFTKDKDIWYLFPNRSATGEKQAKSKEFKWKLYNLNNIKASDALQILQQRFPEIEFLQTNKYGLAFFSKKETEKHVEDLLSAIDQKEQIHKVQLKHIKTKELLEHLPPSAVKDDITETGNEDIFFFNGTPEKLALFLEDLEVIDRPRKLIRYDLLILQYTKGSSLSWGISQGVKNIEKGDRNCITGELGNVLNINFDLITHFGLLFSEKINAALAANEAYVYADTTLYGLEGEKISFKNTSTYRYRDITQGKDEALSSITREINSGLLLDIDGWVSGEGIITMDVKASVSKQGTDLSKNTGNPPPTSEKYITTKVRAKSGEAVILSGLSQSDETLSTQGAPLLSKIPILGGLFKNLDKTKEKTEMTLYLVPHIEESADELKKTDWQEKAFNLAFSRLEESNNKEAM